MTSAWSRAVLGCATGPGRVAAHLLADHEQFLPEPRQQCVDRLQVPLAGRRRAGAELRGPEGPQRGGVPRDADSLRADPRRSDLAGAAPDQGGLRPGGTRVGAGQGSCPGRRDHRDRAPLVTVGARWRLAAAPGRHRNPGDGKARRKAPLARVTATAGPLCRGPPDRDPGPHRHPVPDRRTGADRCPVPDRRAVPDRRTVPDRRAVPDRRGNAVAAGRGASARTAAALPLGAPRHHWPVRVAW